MTQETSMTLQNMQVLIACRGPIAGEALRIISQLDMPKPDIVISRHEWFDSLEARAPWLCNRNLYRNAYLVPEYSDMDSIIDIAGKNGVNAIYVGYGFLAENPDFARLCHKNRIKFVGPDSKALELLGDKERARLICRSLEIPVVPGVESIEKTILEREGQIREQLEKRLQKNEISIGQLPEDIDEALAFALSSAREQKKTLFQDKELAEAVHREIVAMWQKHGKSFPVRIKASAGGGGKGQRVVDQEQKIESALSEVWSEIGASEVGGNKSVILERNLEGPRHMEVQILGDGSDAVHFGVRDCSMQTMFYQKLIEIGLHQGQIDSWLEQIEQNSELGERFIKERDLLGNLQNDALRLVKSIGYQNAGTVEFLVDEDCHYYFMEVNARIQVEHGVSEEISRVHGKKVSLVAEQLRIAAGEQLGYSQNDITFEGYALETRISLLDSLRLQPAPGATIEKFSFDNGDGIRIEDSMIEAALKRNALNPPPSYDANIALNIYYGKDWQKVLKNAVENLRTARIEGEELHTTIPFHIAVLTWLRNNQPYPRVTTDFVSTYLCFLISGQKQLQQMPKVVQEISDKRKPHPWQIVASEVFTKLAQNPNFAMSFYFDYRDKLPAPVVLRDLVRNLNLSLWAEDKKYFEQVDRFFNSLSDLCRELAISENYGELLSDPEAVDNCPVLVQVIARVEKVDQEKAKAALKQKLMDYSSLPAVIVQKFMEIRENCGIMKLVKEDKDLAVILPEPFAKAEQRKEFLQSREHGDKTEQGVIYSPVLGIYYSCPKPGDPVFVEIGQSVKEGQTLCLVGAMKVYSELQAPCDGIVKEILVDNETLVKVGQKLIVLE